MKKVLIDKKTGKSVKIGDLVKFSYHKEFPDGSSIEGTHIAPLTEKRVKRFLKKGILVEQTFGTEKHSTVPMEADHYIRKFYRKILGTNPNLAFNDTVPETVIELAIHYPAAFFGILLREVALEMDNHHHGMINNCEEIYYISTFDGKVYHALASEIDSFKNFAAFRSKEEAETAIKILQKYYDDCFKK